MLQGSQISNFSSKNKVESRITEIYFKVKPDSEKFEVSTGQIPEAKLKRKAEKGKANTELLRKLEKITGEKPGIISGHSSRRKKLIFDQDEEKIREKLEQSNEA